MTNLIAVHGLGTRNSIGTAGYVQLQESRGTRKRVRRRIERFTESHYTIHDITAYEKLTSVNPANYTIHDTIHTKNKLFILLHDIIRMKNKYTYIIRNKITTIPSFRCTIYGKISSVTPFHYTIYGTVSRIKRLKCDAHPSVDIIHAIIKFLGK